MEVGSFIPAIHIHKGNAQVQENGIISLFLQNFSAGSGEGAEAYKKRNSQKSGFYRNIF